jgi:tetratricopeptide (TPR) repeat protein
MGEKGLAIKSANRAVRLAPASSQAFNTLGRAELARFNYDNAIIAFRQATELNADNTWAWNNLGFTHLQLKHYQDAIDALETATEKKDAAGFMFNNLGIAYEQLDQLDEAREAFESGGKLGSLEAMASRKRLEGVDSIAIVTTAKAEPALEEKTYENVEEMPPMPEDVIEPADVVEPAKIEESKPVAPEVDDEPAAVDPSQT